MKSYFNYIFFLIVSTAFTNLLLHCVLVVGDNNNVILKCELLIKEDLDTTVAPIVKDDLHSCLRISTQNKLITVEGPTKTLYEDTFKNIPKLFDIKVVNVSLQEIQSGTFKDLPVLRSVYLEDNNLHEIKNGSFANLKIQWLHLGGNSISVLHPGAFQNLSDMWELNLARNHLREIQQGVFQNLSLVVLDLKSNNISKIEAGTFLSVFGRSGYELTLLLPNNKLEHIDSSAFQNKDLSKLTLDKNCISVLRPGDLRNLPNLQIMSLTRNQIREIPEGVFNGSKIQELFLNHNEISVIASGAFDGMKHLQTLHIAHNKLKDWNSNWFQGAQNTIFDFSYNSFDTVPAETFKHVPRYSWLYLHHNRIKNVSDRAFDGVRKLKLLDLSYNELENWKEDILEDIEVDIVNLRSNKIECPLNGSVSLVPNAWGVELDNCPYYVLKNISNV